MRCSQHLMIKWCQSSLFSEALTSCACWAHVILLWWTQTIGYFSLWLPLAMLPSSRHQSSRLCVRNNNTCESIVRVTTCLENLENLEMSGNLKHVREMSVIMLTVREMSGEKSCQGKVSQNCSLVDEYLRSHGYLSHPYSGSPGYCYLNISISFKNSA